MELSIGIRLVIIFPTFLFLTGCLLKSIIESRNLAKIYNEITGSLMEKIPNENIENNEQVIIEKYETMGIAIKNFIERSNDFLFIFGIESIIILLANGLIIIFELQQSEIGVVSMIFGILLSLFLLIGIYSDKNSAIYFGYYGVFGLLGGELAYFITFGTEKKMGMFPIESISLTIGVMVGILIAMFIHNTLFPEMGAKMERFLDYCKK